MKTLLSLICIVLLAGCASTSTTIPAGTKHEALWRASCPFTIRLCKQEGKILNLQYKVEKTGQENEYLIAGTVIVTPGGDMPGPWDRYDKLKMPFYFIEGQTIAEVQIVYTSGLVGRPVSFSKRFKTDKMIRYSYMTTAHIMFNEGYY